MLSREEMLWFQACCRSTGIILVASTDTQGGGDPTLPFQGRWLSPTRGEGGAAAELGPPSRAAGTGGGHKPMRKGLPPPTSGGPQPHVGWSHDHELSPDWGRCFGVSVLRATKVMPMSSSFSGSECSAFSSSDSRGTTTGSEHRRLKSLTVNRDNKESKCLTMGLLNHTL